MSNANDDLGSLEEGSQERRVSVLRKTIAIVAIVAAGLAVLYVYSDGNRRASLATHLIFGEKDYPSAVAYRAGLNARFPRGTPTELLIKFVEDQGGECLLGHDVIYLCRIPYERSFCSVQMVDIRFPSHAVIEELDVKLGVKGCWI